MNRIALCFFLLLQSSTLLAGSIRDHLTLEAGDGATLYLEVSGASRNLPLVLFLHGGPGAITHLVMFQSTVGPELESSFLVAYLHQRGTGKSSSVPDSEQTISKNVSDVDRVVDYLTRTYGQKQVSLIGHSWGGMLAGAYVVSHPEKIQRLVLIATAMNFKVLLKDSYEGDLEWARRMGSSEAIRQLTALDGSFSTPDDFGTILGLADQAGGTAKGFDMDVFAHRLHIDRDFPDWKSRQQQAIGALIPEMLKLNLDSSMAQLHIPVLFVSGALDTIVRERTMRRDYENYHGPRSFVLLKRSHHLPFVDQPDALARALRGFLT